MSDLFDIDKWLNIELKIRNHAGIAFKNVMKRDKDIIKLESIKDKPQRYKKISNPAKPNMNDADFL